MRTLLLQTLRFTCVVLLAQPVLAHVVISPAEVPQGSSQKLSFRIAHGCGNSPTTSVRITLPETVQGAKPMVKAGWRIAVEKQALIQPRMSHGKTVNEDVRTITWQGGVLESTYFDEFSILATMPAQVGKLPIRVTQTCEQGQLDWFEVQATGEKRELNAPAPLLKVVPASTMEHHH